MAPDTPVPPGVVLELEVLLVLEVEVLDADDVLVLELLVVLVLVELVVITPAGRRGLSSQAIPSLSLSRSSGSPG